MKLKIKSDYHTVIKYLLTFLSFVVFNRLESTVYPYSVAVFVVAMVTGSNVFLTPLLFISSFFITADLGLLLSATLPSVIFMIIVSIYRHFNVKLKAEVLLYTLLSMLVYIIIGDTVKTVPIEKRILVSIAVIGMTFVCLISANALITKGLKQKFGNDEKLALFITIAIFGLGVCNLSTPLVWKSVAIFLIMLSAYVFRFGKSLVLSAILGIPLAIFYTDISYLSIFLAFGLVAECSLGFSRYICGVGILAVEYLIEFIFGVYGGYAIIDLVFSIIGCVCFLVIPKKVLDGLKEKLYAFREKNLSRQAINRNRIMTSNRLYELSNVFNEMANSFSLFKKIATSEHSAKESIKKEVINSVCSTCERLSICKSKKSAFIGDLNKVMDIGFAKGKLSLIDIPEKLSGCVKTGEWIFAVNKLLAEYRARLLERTNLETGRELIASEASGVAEILKGLALETGSTLKYQSRLERSIGEELFKAGFSITEILIYGEGERTNVSLIICMKEYSVQGIELIISKCLGFNISLVEKFDVSEDKCYLNFKKAADFDAVFGVASVMKDGSEACGDTHSVVRIKEDRFMVALSDGMGSGKEAENLSSVSLSLIESFYKAGLKNQLILNTVNKLLAINTTDSFTALDVSIIDLKNCQVDFIKYGSPYAFIIGESGIRIVEGNSLPLGILEELKPAVCTTTLQDGDIVLFMSDGIADCFASSGDLIDFLRSLPSFNPQTLSDEVLKKALENSGGIKKDDMTALAVRIFKKQPLTA
ncbi:MAG: hypothetical protein E7369_02650 [Clostridiales bacterium]|nr:hypothetical protein [Clostridiales bacterium]